MHFASKWICSQLMEDELKEKELPETLEHLKKLQQSGNLLLSIINNEMSVVIKMPILQMKHSI